jgi:hypothetical protein
MFEVGEAYETVMGRWSRQLAPVFVDLSVLGMAKRCSILDAAQARFRRHWPTLPERRRSSVSILLAEKKQPEVSRIECSHEELEIFYVEAHRSPKGLRKRVLKKDQKNLTCGLHVYYGCENPAELSSGESNIRYIES